MSRYYPITNSGPKSELAHGGGNAEAITFRKQSKTEKSFLTRGGSSGTSQERMNETNSTKSVGEY
jgi:hypothetical protein